MQHLLEKYPNPKISIHGDYDKSVLYLKLLDYFDDIPSKIVFTTKNYNFFKSYGNIEIYKNNFEKNIENILKYQHACYSKTDETKLLLIIDDCFDSKLLNNTFVQELILYSHFYNISLIFASSFVINPRYANNTFTHTFLFYDDNSLGRNYLFVYYEKNFMSFNDFHETFAKLKKTQNVLLIDIEKSIKKIIDLC